MSVLKTEEKNYELLKQPGFRFDQVYDVVLNEKGIVAPSSVNTEADVMVPKKCEKSSIVKHLLAN